MLSNKKLMSALFLSTAGLFASAPAIAKNDFTNKLQSYYQSSQELQSQVLQAVFVATMTLQKEPNVPAVKKQGEALPGALEKFEDNFSDLAKLMDKQSIKAQYSSVIEKVYDEDVTASIPKLEAFSKAYTEFADSMQSETFTVYAKEGWANSGITVNKGDLIWVKSEGSWKASSHYAPTNSEGYVCRSDAYTLNRNAPLGALLYRVRGSSSVNGRALQQENRGQADASGRLEFIMNDEDRRNNLGQLRLQVVVMDSDDIKELASRIQGMQDKDS
ncbi:hypothetical protein [Marinobacter sp. NFXS9]|uniref:hypothetical protein n=1 Tax=Marinobacter sp. NFXS9 TaxID=2818433 RepID=UPI0032E0283D